MERPDEEIYEFVNGMWPDLGFTVVDLRKPNGERFRQLLICFLELFYGKINFSKVHQVLDDVDSTLTSTSIYR